MIELEKLSTADLAKLISAAMNEYQRRLSAPTFVATPEPQAPAVISPTESDKANVAACLRLLKTGGVIRADDVREYRRIANDSRTGCARNVIRTMCAAHPLDAMLTLMLDECVVDELLDQQLSKNT